MNLTMKFIILLTFAFSLINCEDKQIEKRETTYISVDRSTTRDTRQHLQLRVGAKAFQTIFSRKAIKRLIEYLTQNRFYESNHLKMPIQGYTFNISEISFPSITHENHETFIYYDESCSCWRFEVIGLSLDISFHYLSDLILFKKGDMTCSLQGFNLKFNYNPHLSDYNQRIDMVDSDLHFISCTKFYGPIGTQMLNVVKNIFRTLGVKQIEKLLRGFDQKVITEILDMTVAMIDDNTLIPIFGKPTKPYLTISNFGQMAGEETNEFRFVADVWAL
jgi:hypothetical protein